MIQVESNTPWKEMYKTYNMGNLTEFCCSREFAHYIIENAKKYNVEAKISGYVTKKTTKDPKLTIVRGNQKYFYN